MWTSDDNGLKVFFIGIGGVGVSALAIYLKELGFFVSGSDERRSEYCETLEHKGIRIFYGHNAKNLVGISDVVVYSSAIKTDNPELIYAKENYIPTYSRAQVLAAICKKYPVSIGVCGAHGKTTTTALIADILHAASARFTAFIGGNVADLGNTCNFGNDIFLGEICEYEKNIEYFKCDVGVFLNIDKDHLDCYEGFDDLVATFRRFYSRSSKRIINVDDKILSSFEGEKISFACDKGIYRATNIKTNKFRLKFDVIKNDKKILKANVALVGRHNAYNVLAAVAASESVGIDKKYIERGLKDFRGVARRNEFIGKINGARVFADYAHHPSEIKRIAEFYNNAVKGKLYIVFQPHTYSRTRLLFKEFVNALKNYEYLYIFKTYAARENYDRSGSAELLAENLPHAKYYENFEKLSNELKKNVRKKDVLLVLGAGDIYDGFKISLNKKMRK